MQGERTDEMGQLEATQLTHDILGKANIGLWAIEIDLGKKPRMFADDTMLRLLGISGKEMTPEQIYAAWYDNIDAEHYDAVAVAVDKMTRGMHAEVQYPWHHPGKGLTYVRCGGIRNDAYKEGVRLEGCHQDVTEMIHIQKQAERQAKELEEIKESSATYESISKALCRDFYAVYYVNFEDNHYIEYNSEKGRKTLGVSAEGIDFFADMRRNAEKQVNKGDRKRFLDFLNKKHLLDETVNTKVISISYRLTIDRETRYCMMFATPADDNDSNYFIFAIRNVDEQVKRENEYAERLRIANELANTDGLTGIKNRLSYEKIEEKTDEEIKNGTVNPFAIVVFDINGLKKTNDVYGHETGDDLILSSVKLICDTFKHSPVFRIGGDEFTAFLSGNDYFSREELLKKFQQKAAENVEADSTVVASGLSEFQFGVDKYVSEVFERADIAMYRNKAELKSLQPMD